MDRTEHSSAQIIRFPAGGRDAVRRAAALPHALLAQAPARPGVDCSAWYHQAAMQEASLPRRS